MKVIQNNLKVSEWTRPETRRKETTAIVLHWTGVAAQRAQAVIDYWNNRKGTWGSAHAVVDLDGLIHQTLPWDEIGYHVGSSKGYTDLKKHLVGMENPNNFMVGIELCVASYEGEISVETMASAIAVTVALCRHYGLDPYTQVITHQMVVGWKQCPKWFVEHPDEFEMFRYQVGRRV